MDRRRLKNRIALPTKGLVGLYSTSFGVHESGGIVSQWDDLSGNDNHLTANPYTKDIIEALSSDNPSKEVIINRPVSNDPTRGIIPGINGYILENAITPPPLYATVTPNSEITKARIFGMSEHDIYKLYGYWLKRKFAISRLLKRIR